MSYIAALWEEYTEGRVSISAYTDSRGGSGKDVCSSVFARVRHQTQLGKICKSTPTVGVLMLDEFLGTWGESRGKTG